MLLMILKYCLITFKGCLMILKCFFNDLSSRSKNFGSQKNYKGGGDRRPPSPLVGFSATQHCSDSYWSLVLVPFNPFWLAGALTNYILWTYLNINLSKCAARIPATALAFAFAVKGSGTKINRIQSNDSSKTGRRPKTLCRSSFLH